MSPRNLINRRVTQPRAHCAQNFNHGNQERICSTARAHWTDTRSAVVRADWRRAGRNFYAGDFRRATLYYVTGVEKVRRAENRKKMNSTYMAPTYRTSLLLSRYSVL